MFNWLHPEPAPPAFAGHNVIPESSASLLSRLTIYWLSPLLKVGFSRPLQQEDLWQLPPELHASYMTAHFERTMYTRYSPEERPPALRDLPSDPRQHDRSLPRAIHAAYWRRIWLAGALRCIAAVTPTLSAFVTRALLAWLTTTHAWHNADEGAREHMSRPAGVGYGIGLAFTLFTMQEIASLVQGHYVILTTATGLIIRTAIIDLLFRKSLRISNKARMQHSVGRFMTMISVDCTALETSLVYFHNIWVTPVVIIVSTGLLVDNLGYSALVGLLVLLLGVPIQGLLMRSMYRQRMKGIAVTDQRVQLTNEILQGIRLIKYYAWEKFYAHRVGTHRSHEITALRRSALAASASAAILAFIPVLAAVLTFVTYAYTGHPLEVSTVFSSLQLFSTMRAPLNMMMYVLRAMLGGHVALKRMNAYFDADDADEAYTVDTSMENAVSVDASFTWESANSTESTGAEASDDVQSKDVNPLPDATLRFSASESNIAHGESTNTTDPLPFILKNVKLDIPRGAFVAIVGPIGSGKSSLAAGMIGEMRRTRGQVVFGGDVAYVPQTPWVMNASVRDNILFGLEDDDAKFREVIRSCCLSRDLGMLPQGENTEIGERGIGLSGGQKARVALARAAYADASIVVMDDCLSAVDAHTSQTLVQGCFLSGPMALKTRILITHTLHVLDKVDYVYVMEKGKIAEHGTPADLRRTDSILSRLLDEYGSQNQNDESQVQPEKRSAKAEDGTQAQVDSAEQLKSNAALMQVEERATGGFNLSTYLEYLEYAGSASWGIVILVLLIAAQGAAVGNNLFLAFWTSESIPGFSQSDYMAVYSALGIAQAVTTFAVSFAFFLLGLAAGSAIFNAALQSVLHSPVSFFDTTPLGRIMNRLSQDQGTIDQDLPINQFELFTSVMTLLGTIVLVFYTIPLLGLIFAPIGLIYYIQTTYYRRSMMETRRIDSLLRSGLFTTISETLTGLSSVRAYRQELQFLNKSQSRIDMQNRAKYTIIFIQRWLSIRLDLCGNILLLGICLYTASQRFSVDPAKIGVILSYSITVTQTLNEMVQLYGTTESNMNSVERSMYYTKLPAEGLGIKTRLTPSFWPSAGGIRFDHVDFAYRQGLPPVLKDLSFTIKPGEKVSIVGRTGAGKSSLLQALFRIAELRQGTITVDRVDVRTIELNDLRHRLSLVPQESVLFSGSLRENLDPQGSKTDAELITILQQAHLLPPHGSQTPGDSKFDLGAIIQEGGENYSAGEKQAIALARALVKNSRVVVLDEATSSVDSETDAKMQRTIQTEFASSTILCIAHRLNTIAWYDQVLVLDAGRLVEHGSPLDLFDAKGIFWSLCTEASLSREDIVRIRVAVTGG